MRYSDLLEERIGKTKSDLKLKRNEFQDELEKSIDLRQIAQSKYTYFVVSFLGLILFRKRIPSVLKKTLKFMIAHLPVKSLFR